MTKRRSRRRRVVQLALLLAAATAMGVGASAGLLLGGAPGEAHLDHPWDIYEYTHHADPGVCACGTEQDPINVVFYGFYGLSDEVGRHAERDDHGEWEYGGGTGQMFFDHGRCEVMDDARASDPSQWLQGRWHMRYNQGGTVGHPYPPTDPDAWDPPWGFYVPAAAHHEDGTGCGHSVDSNNNEPPGGFNMAEEELIHWWVDLAPDEHTWYQEVWNNTYPFRQCDGGYAWNDPWVTFISICSPAGCGDANSDGDVDAVDALFVLQYVLELRQGDNLCVPGSGVICLPRSDVTGDGVVDAVDILFILQHVLGLRPNLCRC